MNDWKSSEDQKINNYLTKYVIINVNVHKRNPFWMIFYMSVLLESIYYRTFSPELEIN